MDNIVIQQPDFWKGNLKGIFRKNSLQHSGGFVFSNIKWIYIHIDQCIEIYDFNADENKTGDYWYAKKIFSKDSWNPFRHKAEIIVQIPPDTIYVSDLYEVLIKNILYTKSEESHLAKDWIEITADIYFSILPVRKKTEILSNPSDNNKLSAINQVVNSISTQDSILYPISNNNSNSSVNTSSNNKSQIQGLTQQHSGRIGKWITGLLVFIILLFFALYLWEHQKILFYLFTGFSLLWAISRLSRLSNLIRNCFSGILFLIFLFVIFYFVNPFQKNRLGFKKQEGSIKVLPDTKNGDDLKSGKIINWFDFSNQFYQSRYQTSEKEWKHSVDGQVKSCSELLPKASSSLDFYTHLYDDLYRMDRQKIRNITKVFSDSARKLSLSPLETAEMVITFVQEIPYYLVHDGSCANAVKSGNDFMIQYHRDKKPCLPFIKGGIQSPYSFMHNLKGDCDTRTLLAFTILKQLNISSSLWVSEKYGHSILGVAVQAGTGMYKTIEGVKHYGVELTAKGYRIGMVAPEQSFPDNWNITLFSNHSN